MHFKNLILKSCAGLSAAVVLASLVSIGSARAESYFSIVGGSSYVLPTGSGVNGFDPDGWVSSANYNINGGTSVISFNGFTAGQGLFINDSVAGPGSLTVNLEFTYEGTEAGYTNVAFGYGGQLLFTNHGPTAASIGDPVPQGFTLGSNPDLLPFIFQSLTGLTMAANGGGVTGGLTPTAIGFLIFDKDGNIALTGPTAYLFFDDSGAGPDRDFDDMVVRVHISSTSGLTPTPLPAALPLFATGLGAMGFLGWRRKRKAARAA